MKTIHDSGYKKLFSNKTIFRQLIETFVEEDWVKDLDFEGCETVDKSFVSDHYKETESDLIYKVRLKDRDIYIFILIEFQSTVDHFMALRILNYITNFYMDYVASNKGVKQLPVVSTLFLAESYYDIELLKDEFLAVFQKESDKQAISLFLNWFKQLSEHQRIAQSDYEKLERVYKNAKEVRAMLITALEKERKQLYDEGKIEGKIEAAKAMLSKGMSVALISEITGLSEEEILKLNSDFPGKS